MLMDAKDAVGELADVVTAVEGVRAGDDVDMSDVVVDAEGDSAVGAALEIDDGIVCVATTTARPMTAATKKKCICKRDV